MSVTIYDVAKRAGVGIGTVSSVINNSRPVSEATRQKVLEAIDELDFVPNLSGRRLSRGKVQLIGVVIPFFVGVSQFERLRGVMSAIAKSDYDITLFVVESISHSRQVLQTVPLHNQLDGLVVFSLVPTEADLRRLRQHNVPAVLVGAYHPDLPCIVLDDVAAAQAAIQHLVDLGHRKIAYVNEYLETRFDMPARRQRYEGYCRALEAANLSLNPAYYCQGVDSYEQDRQKIMDLLSMVEPPSAVLTYSDPLALSVLKIARDLDLNIPGDLSIISYEDTELAQVAQLTAVRQHLFKSGAQGVELLFNLINNPDLLATCLHLPVELVIRQTTARASLVPDC